MNDEQEKKLFTPIMNEADIDLAAEDIEFDESILDDDFADMLKNGLDTAFDAEGIFVSDDLFAKTMAAIEECKKEENGTAGNGENNSVKKMTKSSGVTDSNEKIVKRPWWKILTPVAAAAIVLGLGIFMVSRMGYFTGGDKCSDTATSNAVAYDSEFSEEEIKDKEIKYSPQSEKRENGTWDGSSEIKYKDSSNKAEESSSGPVYSAEAFENLASDSCENVCNGSASSASGEASRDTTDPDLIIDNAYLQTLKADDQKSYIDKWITVEDSRKLLSFLVNEAVLYEGDDEKYTSEVADGLKAILYLYSENILLSKRYLCYEDRVIVISRESTGEVRTIYLADDYTLIDELIEK